MKQIYKPLTMRVVEMSQTDVLANGSVEATDAPFLTDVYSKDDWIE